MKLAKYKACICEGSAESAIIDILVDLNCNKKLQKLYRRKLSISRTRALMIKYYKDLIIEYIRKYGKAKKKDIRELLWDKLPDVFDDKKRTAKFLHC